MEPASGAIVIRVLADAELQELAIVTDRAGRRGLGMGVDSDQGRTRDVAVFDAVSGELLSYELVELISPSNQVRVPAVLSYLVFLARSRTGTMEQRSYHERAAGFWRRRQRVGDGWADDAVLGRPGALLATLPLPCGR